MFPPTFLALRCAGMAVLCLSWSAVQSAPAAPAAPVWTNTLGMPFVRVPAGQFRMGSDEPLERMARDFPLLERQRLVELADEAPVHTVRITRPFYLGQAEVTVGQFRRFVAASGYRAESEADGTGGYGYNPDYDPATTRRGDAFEGRDPRYSWRNPGFAQGDDHPVVNVTWHDAHALAAWLSATEGHRYRLPTEAEWEYACRAGTTTRWPSGDDPAALPREANLFDQSAAPYWPRWQQHAVPGNDGYAFTSPVTAQAPNAFGLHGMVGNAWEWVSDFHDEATYAVSPRDDPQGPATGNVRVRRGGSWHTWPVYARCSYRNWNAPDTRYTLVGIRLVRELDAPAPAAAQRDPKAAPGSAPP
ncbi:MULTISPECIES: formylglycine-generating enzyme family protein [unclassified Acidovorax]|uniref:formylglycine-generating enzyme family protein n=1 Tax=unclassified Acidovorax TaxID=2684926 RepID=UPI00385785C3